MASVYRRRFYAVYGLLAAATLAAAVLLGHSLRNVETRQVPAYCAGTKGFARCLGETLAAQAGASVPVSCHPVAGMAGSYSCRAKVGGLVGETCYDLAARRAVEGWPILETAAERSSC